MTRYALPLLFCVALVPLGACSDDGGSGSDACTPLAGDVLNAAAVYSADGEPLVIVRLDLGGTCAGSGPETFVIYRPTGLVITTDTTPIDPMMLPESEPGSSTYVYRTDGVTLEIRREATMVTLAFMDMSAMPPGVRCLNVDDALSCTEI